MYHTMTSTMHTCMSSVQGVCRVINCIPQHCHHILSLLVLLLAAVNAESNLPSSSSSPSSCCLCFYCRWWCCSGSWSSVGLSGGSQEGVVLCLQGGWVQEGLMGGECFRLLLFITTECRQDRYVCTYIHT